MLVFNEIKLYRDFQQDCEFAMIKDNYNARVYSPFGGPKYGEGTDVVDFNGQGTKQTRYYKGVDNTGKAYYTFDDDYVIATEYSATGVQYYTKDENNVYTEAETPITEEAFNEGTFYIWNTEATRYPYDRVTTSGDYYEPHFNEDPFHIAGLYKEKMMKEGTKMVPRVLKTNVGDIYTTNTIDETTLAVGDILSPRTTDGILVNEDGTHKTDIDDHETMKWQVVKVYTMPDHQKGVKIMRIA